MWPLTLNLGFLGKIFGVLRRRAQLGLVQSADELGQELDTSDGVTWMLYTRDADEAAECLDLVNDEASHGITVLLDIPRERLPGWVEDHEHAIMPVPW